VAPNHGAFPDLMTDNESGNMSGVLFAPADIDDLEQKVMALWNDRGRLSQLGNNALDLYNKRFEKETVNRFWDRFLHEITEQK
jgi:glycosyltransferase involved in cell wall biosynthesis